MWLLRTLATTLVLAIGLLAAPTSGDAAVSIGISVGFAPPPLPIYEQPVIPAAGYLWVPGYWAWGPDGYYWVPGTWVLPPAVGLLWTPPWWGWSDGVYLFHAGYWGPHVGFYGGIDYGFGYFGHGYEGGHWDHDRFFYNREVNNIRNVNITNVYDQRVTRNETTNRVSFNGGRGGITARPSAQEQAAASERHVQATALQTRNLNAARSNRSLWASTNHGNPSITATSHAGRFNAAAGATATPGATGRSTGQAGATNRTAPRATTNVGRRAPGSFGSPAQNAVRQSPGSPSRNAVRQSPNRTFAHTAPTNLGRPSTPTVRQGAPRSFGSAAPRNAGPRAPANFGRVAPRNFGAAAPRSAGPRAPANVGRAAAPRSVGHAAPARQSAPGNGRQRHP